MTHQRYPETFKIEAVKQITERGRPMADVVRALGVSSHSLYTGSGSTVSPLTSSSKSLSCSRDPPPESRTAPSHRGAQYPKVYGLIIPDTVLGGTVATITRGVQ